MKPPQFQHFPENISELLLSAQCVNPQQLQQLERVSSHTGTTLIGTLVEHGLIEERTLMEILRHHLRLPTFELEKHQPDGDALREVPQDLANRHHIYPIRLLHRGHTRVLQLAMVNPLDWHVFEEVSFYSGCEVDPLIATLSTVQEALRLAYRSAITRVMPRHVVDQGAQQTVGQPHRALDPEVHTEPNLQIQRASTPTHRVDALVALLIRKGVITQQEYETQLSEIIRPGGIDDPADDNS